MSKKIEKALKREINNEFEGIKTQVKSSEQYLAHFKGDSCHSADEQPIKIGRNNVLSGIKSFIFGNALRISAIVGIAIFVFVACFLVLTIGTTEKEQPENYSIYISAAPSVKLICEDDGTVTLSQGLDIAGVKMLYLDNFNGQNVSSAISRLIALLDRYGYLSSTDTLYCTVEGANAQSVQPQINAYLEWNLSKIVGNATIVTSHPDDTLQNIKEYAQSTNTLQLQADTLAEYKTQLSIAVSEKLRLLESAKLVLETHSADNGKITFLDTERDALREYATNFSSDLYGYSLSKLTGADASALTIRLDDVKIGLQEKQQQLEYALPQNNWENLSRDILELAKTLMNETTQIS